eukprot:2181326-Amphidinium_carterae.1
MMVGGHCLSQWPSERLRGWGDWADSMKKARDGSASWRMAPVSMFVHPISRCFYLQHNWAVHGVA